MRVAAETRIRELEAENEKATGWARDAESRLAKEIEDKVQCLQLLQEAERTVEERTVWAQSLKAQADELEHQVIQMKESRWVKFGRRFGLGPDLPNS